MNLPHWLWAFFEADAEKFLPYAGHVEPSVVMLMDGSLMIMFRLHGSPFELEDVPVRVGRRDRLNTLLRILAGNDLTISFHLVRHRDVSQPPQPMARTAFVRTLMANYERIALQGMYTNEWFITAIVHPATSVKRKIRERIPFLRRLPLEVEPNMRRRLEDVAYLIETTLSEYQPTRLGVEDVETDIPGHPLPVTQMGSALYLMRTAHKRPVPHTFGSMANAIYTEPVVVGPLAFDPNIPGVDRVGSMQGFNNYPAKPRPGMFNPLLATPYPVVMHHSCRFRSQGSTVTALALLQQQMRNSGDKARSLMDGLDDAMDDAASLRTATGIHHFSCAVYADNALDLDRNVADAHQRISQWGGAAPVRERNIWYAGALETSYYTQLPGTTIFKPRPGTISTMDLADMASLDNYPVGEREGYWGPSIVRFKTNGGTAYDFVTHDEDVGHTTLTGSNGKGKTVLLGTVAAFLEPVMGDDGIRILVDKDQANRLLVEACGGTYTQLRRNIDSGLAPLVALANTPRNQAYLHRLYTWLIESDGGGKIKPLEDSRLARGIRRQLQMPPHKRSMSGVREFLGYQDDERGAGARFERWCAGGSMGWLLDNRDHLVRIGPGFHGFDFSELIPEEGVSDDGACTVAASVIAHHLRDFMDGRRIAAFFDECRFYMVPLKQMIDDFTLTGRKKELMCWLVAQQPEHFTDSDIGMSLVAQCRTKIIFPDANLNDDGLRKMKVSEAAIRLLKTDMTIGNARRFLLWRQGAPAVCEFDLTGLPEMALLSGREGTIRLMQRVREDTPEEEVIPEFYRRLANVRRAA